MKTGTENETLVATPSDREIVLRRILDATPKEVFDAIVDRETIGEWFGPEGFTLTTYEMDVRPGGVWRFTMHGPDGTDYENFVRYRTVDPPRRLEYDQGASAGQIDFRTTIDLTESGGKTEITLRSVFRTAQGRDRAVKEYGAIEGGKQHLARLARHLETKQEDTE